MDDERQSKKKGMIIRGKIKGRKERNAG